MSSLVIATQFGEIVDKRLAQSAQPHFAIFEQPQSSAHNVTGWPITARGNCLLDERAAVLVETERGLALVALHITIQIPNSVSPT